MVEQTMLLHNLGASLHGVDKSIHNVVVPVIGSLTVWHIKILIQQGHALTSLW